MYKLMNGGGLELKDILWLILIIIIFASGFSIRMNNYSFEWIGILEQIWNVVRR